MISTNMQIYNRSFFWHICKGKCFYIMQARLWEYITCLYYTSTSIIILQFIIFLILFFIVLFWCIQKREWLSHIGVKDKDKLSRSIRVLAAQHCYQPLDAVRRDFEDTQLWLDAGLESDVLDLLVTVCYWKVTISFSFSFYYTIFII